MDIAGLREMGRASGHSRDTSQGHSMPRIQPPRLAQKKALIPISDWEYSPGIVHSEGVPDHALSLRCVLRSCRAPRDLARVGVRR
jgi:hypothetical protein